MEHLNFCRNFKKQLRDRLDIPNTNGQDRVIHRHLIDLCDVSHKFLLPEGGILLNDFSLKALDNEHPLRLPYQFIALEWVTNSAVGGPATRMIAFVRERLESHELLLTSIGFINADATWSPLEDISIPMTGYLARDHSKDGRVAMNFEFSEFPQKRPGDLETVFVSTVLSFLNALECSNVHIAKSDPRKSNKKVKAALPFDTYHLLTIDCPGRSSNGTGAQGQHRAPREHLRRGHIRRLENGRRVWINATVVSAGKSIGVVKKDYAFNVRAAGATP